MKFSKINRENIAKEGCDISFIIKLEREFVTNYPFLYDMIIIAMKTGINCLSTSPYF